jgi:hypothetical protein
MSRDRTIKQLFVFLAFFLPACAFARGGPAAFIGAILDRFFIMAIVGGLLAGIVTGLAFRWLKWRMSVLTAVSWVGVAAAALVTLGSRSFLTLYTLPLTCFFLIFVLAANVARTGFFDAERSLDTPTSFKAKLRLGSARDVLRWAAATYLFWVAVSLVNFDLLGFVLIPPLALRWFKYLPFLLPPLAVAAAIAVAIVSHYSATLRAKGANSHLFAFAFNICLLASFLPSAEIYRHYLMTRALSDHTPAGFHYYSFLHSVLNYTAYFRSRHAGFSQDGEGYNWSYSEREFYPSGFARDSEPPYGYHHP